MEAFLRGKDPTKGESAAYVLVCKYNMWPLALASCMSNQFSYAILRTIIVYQYTLKDIPDQKLQVSSSTFLIKTGGFVQMVKSAPPIYSKSSA